MQNVRARSASGARFGVIALIAAVAGCSGPRVIESHSSRATAKRSAHVAATYYLPKQLVAVQVERRSTPEEGTEDVLTVWLRPPIADPRTRFYVQMPRDNKYTLQTTEDGLLTSTNAPAMKPEGRELGTFRVTAPPVAKGCAPVEGLIFAPPPTARSLTTTVVFDPTLAQDIARAEGELCSSGAQYRFVLSRVDPSVPQVVAPSLDAVYAGLIYRRAEHFILSIFKVLGDRNDALTFVTSTEVSMPNAAPLERMPLPELATTTKEGVAFQSGMLAARANLAEPKRRRFQISFSSRDDASGLLGTQSALPVAIHTEVNSEPAAVKVKGSPAQGGQQ